MVKRTIVIKNVDEDIYLDFRAEVVRKKLLLGKALSEAMKIWLKEKVK